MRALRRWDRPKPASHRSISSVPWHATTMRSRMRLHGRYGRLDGLVHNAAILGALAPIEHYDVPTWCRVLHVNLTAAFALTQVLLPVLRAAPDRLGRVHQQRRRPAGAGLLGRLLRSRSSASRHSAHACGRGVEHGRQLRVNALNPGRCARGCAAQAYPGRGSDHDWRSRRTWSVPTCGC